MKTKSSGAGAGAMFMKRSSGAGAVLFLRRLRSPGNFAALAVKKSVKHTLRKFAKKEPSASTFAARIFRLVVK